MPYRITPQGHNWLRKSQFNTDAEMTSNKQTSPSARKLFLLYAVIFGVRLRKLHFHKQKYYVGQLKRKQVVYVPSRLRENLLCPHKRKGTGSCFLNSQPQFMYSDASTCVCVCVLGSAQVFYLRLSRGSAMVFL